MNALEWVFSREDVLVDLASELKSSTKVPTRVRKLSDDLGHVRELDSIRANPKCHIASAEPEMVGGISALIVRQDGVKGGDLRTWRMTRGRLGSGAVLLVSANGPKVALLVTFTDDLKGRFHAGKVVGQLATCGRPRRWATRHGASRRLRCERNTGCDGRVQDTSGGGKRAGNIRKRAIGSSLKLPVQADVLERFRGLSSLAP